MRTLICLLIFCMLSVSASAEINTPRTIIGVATVIDGDTIKINGNNIRLNGIDAPERKQSCTYEGSEWLCGQKATLALSELIRRETVNCHVSGRDRYKRSIAICFVGRLDLNAWMVEQGWAVANRKYLTDYVMQEDEARQEKRGIWKGEFVMPWDWRAQKKKS